MSKRAKRGLGFVVLAFLFWLVAIPMQDATSSTPGTLAFLVVAVAMIGCGIYGLVTLALGLIRD